MTSCLEWISSVCSTSKLPTCPGCSSPFHFFWAILWSLISWVSSLDISIIFSRMSFHENKVVFVSWKHLDSCEYPWTSEIPRDTFILDIGYLMKDLSVPTNTKRVRMWTTTSRLVPVVFNGSDQMLVEHVHWCFFKYSLFVYLCSNRRNTHTHTHTGTDVFIELR